ncbi:MAG: helix-turn-helix transcriptional regulator [Clostridia bacterium]|nr:helix-turn-helix transcriptional regulator [Clostridia bacterium]
MNEILRMRVNLMLFRKLIGWTAEQLGEKIGVTRQTINNIESGRSTLTKTQYIAIRCMFDAEIANSPNDTQMVSSLLDMLIDNPDAYTDDEADQLLRKATMLAPSVISGTVTRQEVSDEWIATKDRIMSNDEISTTKHVYRTIVVPTKIGRVTEKVIGGTWLQKLLFEKEYIYEVIETTTNKNKKTK